MRAKLKHSKLSRWILPLILLGFLVAHIPHITAPPLDQHWWRQSDTAAVARNFAEESANILYPRIDMREQFSGITGMEFPLYNYLIYLVNAVFGFAHWHGRIISLAFSLMGLGFFYGFVRQRYDQATATVAAITLGLLPLWFYFSRNIQPDTAMVSLALASLYFAQRFRNDDKPNFFYAGIAALSLACLIKIPAIFIGAPLLIILGLIGLKRLLNPRYIAAIILLFVVPNLAWYLHAENLSNNYGLGHYYIGDISPSATWQLITHGSFWRIIALYNLPVKLSTLMLVVSAAGGLLVGWFRRDWLPAGWAFAVTIFLVLFASKSYYHNYYSLPMMAPLALLMSLGLDWIKGVLSSEKRSAGVLVVILFFAALGWYSVHSVRPLYAQDRPYYIALESDADRVSTRGELEITNGNDTPMLLYFAHRKGWSLGDSQLTDSALSGLYHHGAKIVIQDRAGNVPPISATGAKLVFEDTNFRIYRLHY